MADMTGYALDPALYAFTSDLPGMYHHRACGFSFADGHSELRRWLDPRTTPPLVPGGTPAIKSSPLRGMWTSRGCRITPLDQKLSGKTGAVGQVRRKSEGRINCPRDAAGCIEPSGFGFRVSSRPFRHLHESIAPPSPRP